METNNYPLVSVPVVTYNSSKYVLETLESIKAQTYQNIELIISDDCSTDDTVQICKDWVEANSARFVRTVILESPVNTGISANGNRAEDACKGEWVKAIAGDDILLETCIDKFVCFVCSHPSYAIVFSRMKSFGASPKKCEWYDNVVYYYDFFSWPSDKQYNFLYNERNCIPAPTCFYNLMIIRNIGLRNDERIPLQEDVAKWQNALQMGLAFGFLDEVTVKYRIHNGSLSTSKIQSPASFRSCELYWFYYHFNKQYAEDPETSIANAVEREVSIYRRLYSILNSKRYKFLCAVLDPIDVIRNYFITSIRKLYQIIDRFKGNS